MADYAREIACDCPPKFSLLQGSLQAEVDAHIQASEAAACRQTGGCMEWWISSCDILCFMIVCIRGCSSVKECLIYTSGNTVQYKSKNTFLLHHWSSGQEKR